MKKITAIRVTAYAIIILIATFCELVVQREAIYRRGYMTIGGEILVFPAIVYVCAFLFERILEIVKKDDIDEKDQG